MLRTLLTIRHLIAGIIIIGTGVILASIRQHEEPIQVEYSISADTRSPGALEIKMAVHGLRVRSAAKMTFVLPDEAVDRKVLEISPTVSTTVRKEYHSGGVTLHFTDLHLTGSPTGAAAYVAYRVIMGQQLRGGRVGPVGPRYGFASASELVTNSEQLLPMPDDGLRGRFWMTLRMTGYTGVVPSEPIQWVTSRPRNELIMAGSLSRGNTLGPLGIETFTSRPPTANMISYLKQLHSVPWLDHESLRWSILSIPGEPTEAFYPIAGSDYIALDLEPFTSDRAVRLGAVLLHKVLLQSLVSRFRLMRSSKEEWLAESIPVYDALKSASAVGLYDFDRAVYDITTSYARSASLHRPLVTYAGGSPVMRNYFARNNGVIALTVLERMGRTKGVSVDDVVKDWLSSRVGVSFRFALAMRVGLKAAEQWWNRYVEAAALPADGAEVLQLKADPPATQHSALPYRLLITDHLDTGIELCGCKVNQSGGAARRQFILSSRRNADTRVLDLGGFFKAPSSAARDATLQMESKLMADLMQRAHYDAIALAPSDLVYFGPANGGKIGNVVSLNQSRFAHPIPISLGGSNFEVIGWSDAPPLREYDTVLETAAVRAGATYDVGQLSANIKALSPGSAGYILIGSVSPKTIRSVLRADTEGHIRAIITTGGQAEFPKRTPWGYLDGRVLLFANAGNAGVTEVQGRVTGNDISVEVVRRHELNDSVPDDQPTRAIIDQFFNSKDFSQVLMSPGSDLSTGTAPVLPVSPDRSFVGNVACASCHDIEYTQWKLTPHGTAFATMYRTHRNHHPRCVSCHSTGYGSQSGYRLAKPDRNLENVGCETCHGPGSQHVIQPRTANIIRIPNPVVVCVACHTPEHSEYYSDPQGYYQRIRHQ